MLELLLHGESEPGICRSDEGKENSHKRFHVTSCKCTTFWQHRISKLLGRNVVVCHTTIDQIIVVFASWTSTQFSWCLNFPIIHLKCYIVIKKIRKVWHAVHSWINFKKSKFWHWFATWFSFVHCKHHTERPKMPFSTEYGVKHGAILQ